MNKFNEAFDNAEKVLEKGVDLMCSSHLKTKKSQQMIREYVEEVKNTIQAMTRAHISDVKEITDDTTKRLDSMRSSLDMASLKISEIEGVHSQTIVH
ncbi:hypothetical protein [Paenibacillus terrae]|uniref:Methyl-accepting chemotaxis protein n=1 Tax=Paenibacillus terrae TaxID=159743 RepID=A0A0D7X6T1_9BACL|nr:hypothetical protein [Paenibacillus terrae]KJD47125.1 hypothetical protein QD47_02935 [Paenibacillus terrae]